MSILSQLFSRFIPAAKPAPVQPVPREGAVLFKVGGVLGDRIQWTNFQTGKLAGWKSNFPKVGDVLTSAMQSGRTVVSIFSEITPCGDPDDMFFATVVHAGYVEDIPFKLPPEQQVDVIDQAFRDVLGPRWKGQP